MIPDHKSRDGRVADWDVLYDALLDPPDPNDRLKEAAGRYRQHGGG